MAAAIVLAVAYVVYRTRLGAMVRAADALFFLPATAARARFLFLASLLPVAAFMVFLGWKLAPQIQPDPDSSDQGAYAYMARQMKDSWWPDVTDGARNPLFPWLAAKFVPPGFQTHEEIRGYLVPGKRFNSLLAAVVMLGIGWYLAGRLAPVPAWNASVISGLGCLLPIAAYFGAEPLFYGLFFGFWMAGIALLQRNPLRLYAGFALLAALAYLAKPSTTPFVALLAVMSLVRCGLNLWPGTPPMLVGEDWKPWRLGAGILIFGLIFGIVTLPKNLYSAQRFEDPFYNAPKVWFWIHDWTEAYPKYQLVRKSDLAALPPEERPGPANFLRKHGWEGAWAKISDGTLTRLEQLFLPEKSLGRKVERPGKPKRVVLPWRGLYLAGSVALLLAMLGFALAKRRMARLGGWVLPTLMALAAFAGYILAYGWFAWIGPGPRYVMSLYLPMLVLALIAADRLRQASESAWADRVWVAAHLVPVVFIFPRAIQLLADHNFDRMQFAF